MPFYFLLIKFTAEKHSISLVGSLLKELEHLLFSAFSVLRVFFHKSAIVYIVIPVKCQLDSLWNQMGHWPLGMSVRNSPDDVIGI